MFFAKYNVRGYHASEFAVFNTEYERNEWVNFKDTYSIESGITPENSTFARSAVNDIEEVIEIIKDEDCKFIIDDLTQIKWFTIAE